MYIYIYIFIRRYIYIYDTCEGLVQQLRVPTTPLARVTSRIADRSHRQRPGQIHSWFLSNEVPLYAPTVLATH